MPPQQLTHKRKCLGLIGGRLRFLENLWGIACHPWPLGPANPWRDDGTGEFSRTRLEKARHVIPAVQPGPSAKDGMLLPINFRETAIALQSNPNIRAIVSSVTEELHNKPLRGKRAASCERRFQRRPFLMRHFEIRKLYFSEPYAKVRPAPPPMRQKRAQNAQQRSVNSAFSPVFAGLKGTIHIFA